MWNRVEPHLTSRNRKLMLKGIWTAMQDRYGGDNSSKTAQWVKLRRFFGVRNPLFHATTGPRAGMIVRGGGIKANSSFSDFGGQVGISATRSLSEALRGNFGPYIFVLDGQAIGSRYKVEPLQHPSASDEMEERIYADKIPVTMIRGLVIDRHVIRIEAEELAESPFPVVYKDRKEGWTRARAAGTTLGVRTAAGNRTPGEICKACGRDIVIGFEVEDDVWDRVVGDEGTVRCALCFDEIAHEKGVPYDFKELHPVSWDKWGSSHAHVGEEKNAWLRGAWFGKSAITHPPRKLISFIGMVIRKYEAHMGRIVSALKDIEGMSLGEDRDDILQSFDIDNERWLLQTSQKHLKDNLTHWRELQELAPEEPRFRGYLQDSWGYALEDMENLSRSVERFTVDADEVRYWVEQGHRDVAKIPKLVQGLQEDAASVVRWLKEGQKRLKALKDFGTGQKPSSADVEKLFHASVNAKGIARAGFSREVPEAGGLGGSQTTKGGFSSKGVSFTSDIYVAKEIARSLREASLIAHGKVKGADIFEWADRAGVGAKVRKNFQDEHQGRAAPKTPGEIMATYAAYLHFAGWEGKRYNPLYVVNFAKFMQSMKRINPEGIGIVVAHVDMNNPDIAYFPSMHEYRVPVDAIVSVDQFIGSKRGSMMRTASENPDGEPWNTCPVCGDEYESSCRCHVGDRSCASGHKWIWCPEHERNVVVPPGVNTHKLPIPRPKGCVCWVADVADDMSREAYSKRATKTPAEREDEAAGDLVKQSPKLKPPRKDLRQERMQAEDPDTNEKDKDTSMNYKDIGASRRVAARFDTAQVLRNFLGADEPSDETLQEHAREQGKKDYDAYKERYPKTDLDEGDFIERALERLQKQQAKDDDEAAAATAPKPEPKMVPHDTLLDPFGRPLMVPEDSDESEDTAPEPDSDGDGEDAEAEEEAWASEREQEAKGQAIQQTLRDIEKVLRKLPGGDTPSTGSRGRPGSPFGGNPVEDFRANMEAKLEGMDRQEREDFAESYKGTLDALRDEPLEGEDALVQAREAIGADLGGMKPKKLGQAMAQAYFAERVTFNPFLLGVAPLSKDVKPATDAEKEEEEAARREKAEAAYDLGILLTSKEREAMVEKIGEQYPGTLDEDSPRARQLAAMYNGLALAAMLQGEEVETPLHSSLPKIPQSEQLGQLASALKTVGKEKDLLGTMGDFTTPEAQESLELALNTMTDHELGELVGQDSPLYAVIETLTGPLGENLSIDEHQRLRGMVTGAVVDNISLLDPMVADYMAANDEKVTSEKQREIRERSPTGTRPVKTTSALEELLGKDSHVVGEQRMTAMQLVMEELRMAKIRNVYESLKGRFKKQPKNSVAVARARAALQEGSLNVLRQRVIPVGATASYDFTPWSSFQSSP